MFVVVFELVEQVVPDLSAGGVVETGVADRDVDARHEGFVEVADAVCGQEQNSLEVVQGTEEDYGQ